MRHCFFCAGLIASGFLSWNPVALSQEQPQEAKEIQLIQGLDGGGYEPYAPRVIERVQETLKTQGLYAGEINGLLDQTTMEALGQFQEQHGLQVSGVPTPGSRRALFQGSIAPPAAGAQQGQGSP